MKKTILLTGSSGFLGKIFLRESLKRKYQVIDILRLKNKKNLELNKLRKNYQKFYKSVFFKDSLRKIFPRKPELPVNKIVFFNLQIF